MHKPSNLGNFPHIYEIYMTKTQNIMMNGWNSLTKGTKQAEQPWLSCAVCFEALAGVVASGGACTSTMKAAQPAKTPASCSKRLRKIRPRACSTFLCYQSIPGWGKKVRRKPMTLNKMNGFPRRPNHARQTTHHTDSQSITPHPLGPRILLQSLVGS